MCGGEVGSLSVHVDTVSHLSLGTPCLQPEGLETPSP
jgi:hypothetical protein